MEGSAVFEIGQEVEVQDVGPGTIRKRKPEADGMHYLVDVEDPTYPELVEVAEAALTPIQTPAREGEEETVVSEPPSVFEQLGRDYAAAREDRREVFPILPGRFHGNLAMRARPVDPTKRKKKVRRIAKTGITDEAEARYAAEIIADACDCILVRMADGEDPIPAHEVPNAGLGDEPVRFDQRLGKVIPALGEILTGGESPAAIVRLLFSNLDALDGFFLDLDQWLKEASPTEEDEEGEGDRPS